MIHGTNFFWTAAFLGIGLYILTIIFLKFRFPLVFDDSDSRFTVYFSYLIGFFLLIPSLGSYLNSALAEQQITCKNFIIVRKATVGTRETAFFLYCKLSDGVERFEVNKRTWDSVQQNKTIGLCTRKGYLGYDLVMEFKVEK